MQYISGLCSFCMMVYYNFQCVSSNAFIRLYVCTYIYTVPPIADYWQSITLILDRVYVHPDGGYYWCLCVVRSAFTVCLNSEQLRLPLAWKESLQTFNQSWSSVFTVKLENNFVGNVLRSRRGFSLIHFIVDWVPVCTCALRWQAFKVSDLLCIMLAALFTKMHLHVFLFCVD